MRICHQCGATTADQVTSCPNCGASVNVDLQRQTINQGSADGLDRIRQLEQSVADYYNQMYFGSAMAGNYVVLHSDTVVTADCCRIMVRTRNNGFVGAPVADVMVNLATNEWTPVNRPVQAYNPQVVALSKTPKSNGVAIVLTIISLLIWAFAPFFAMNLRYIGDQPPSALQIVMGDCSYVGELYSSPQFILSVVTGVILLICLLSLSLGVGGVSRGFSIVALVLMSITFILVIAGTLAEDPGDLFQTLGLGFWALFGLFISLICTSRSRK